MSTEANVTDMSPLSGASTSPSTSPTASQRFKNYWQAALKAFGATEDDGMILQNGARNVATEDKDEVIELLKAGLSAPLPAKYEGHIVDTHLLRLPSVSTETTDVNEARHSQVNHIIEIGAGNGRLSCYLQSMCRELTCVDFIDEYIIENEKQTRKADRPSDRFIQGDARVLQFPDRSMDVVFWNWLLMYLEDDEAVEFITKAKNWVKIGGLLFCRESCGEPSTKNPERDWAPEGNPSEYRPKEFYTNCLKSNQVIDASGGSDVSPVFEVLLEEHLIMVYKEQLNTEGQRCWLLRRVA
eukprot:GHVN01008381.1.p1 GENE.GHVN01008381.1~~GHVN01008381.1.p1  ORF type:complete len:298 (-),score=62.94 GHVN01008381.1:684-1577(-)